MSEDRSDIKLINKRNASAWIRIRRHPWLYIMLFFPVAYYLIFKYAPMFGLVVAFKDYNPFVGIWESPWAGLRHFQSLFNSLYFPRLIRNTIAISVIDMFVNFPAPIILALLLNEVRNAKFKRVVQTVSYLPHFVSSVVIAGMLVEFLSPRTGLINNIIKSFGGEPIFFLSIASYFWPVFTIMNTWKGIGWGSIIYLAAIMGIDPTLYEAATVDGAGHLKQTWHITLPGLLPTIVVLFIMRIGNLLEVSYESIILIYNSRIYETADVIGTFVYRRGLVDADYSFASAVGLFQSVLGFFLVVIANKISKKVTETSLW